MPELIWDGKDKALDAAKNISARLLDFDTSLSVGESENLIVQGDNLLVLKSLLPLFRRTVKCIYIDPPYNTGSVFEHYNDNFPHADWLNFMYPRLELLRDFLADDGAIFISIDDNEVHYLKVICDEIFGRNNFFATLTWRSMHTVRNSSKDFNRNSDFILVYAKNKERLTSDKNFRIREKVDKSKDYKFNDNDGRGFYKLDPIYARNYAKPYTFTFQNGIVWTAPEGSFPRYSQATLTEMERTNRLDFNGKFPRAKRYLNEVQDGQPPDTFLATEKVGFNSDGTKTLAKILGVDKAFSQPKPVKLIEYLIGILPSNENALILDAFAGSGTTAHAVINLNAQDGGNRKFILIESQDYCSTITAERVKRVGGEFKFARLGEKILLEDGTLNPAVTDNRLAETVWFNATGLPLTQKFSLPLLGEYAGAAIYLLRDEILTRKKFNSLPAHDGEKIIYGAACRLDEDFMRTNKIIFKSIAANVR